MQVGNIIRIGLYIPLDNYMNSTIVTGIWNLDRSSLSDGWCRPFDHYLDNFTKLLECKNLNLAIFIDPELEDMVWKIRDRSNTVVYPHPSGSFSGDFFPFYDEVQKIRCDPKWLNQVGWLKDSTQAKIPGYNPMVMSKMFLLHNVKIFNPFNSDYFYWLDGGITNTVHPGYFTHDSVIEKIEDCLSKFLFICFPYETSTEIHGFDINEMKKYANSPSVNRVARGGFFGGPKDQISQINGIYYSLLKDSLNSGLMGTEESIFTLMTYLHPDLFSCEKIEDNGLINLFFENVKDYKTDIQIEAKNRKHENNKISLYINTYNAPGQLKMLLDSFEKYEPSFLEKTEKILINNSTREEYFDEYDIIVKKYDFVQIREGNLGICRARQLAAEHFAESKNKYMFFFEDDMLIDLSDTRCSFGFNKNVKSLFSNLVNIMNKENYDFLKFSFSEFYGNNSEQWSWHNVPQHSRDKFFEGKDNRPNTVFKNIKSLNETVYADGEIYYSNWPHIISQEGNQKCFLDTKWANPFEQTWMSHMYSLTKENILNPAILLASPITHNRIYHYDACERKEN
jgi:Bacterial protein of unknown function (HtrL_YibB)